MEADTSKYRRIFRVTLGVGVVGSPGVVLPISTGLDAGVQASLFALIAATALAVTLGARPDRKLERILNTLVRVAAVAASAYSAYQWLLSADAGTGIELVGAALAALAVIAFWVNSSDMDATIAKQDRCDGGHLRISIWQVIARRKTSQAEPAIASVGCPIRSRGLAAFC